MSPLDKIANQGELTLGLVFPLESYAGSVPKMEHQEALAKEAEEVGIKALWFRDVPLHDPTFGDAGQMFDPFVYMAHILNHTTSLALATGSIILPLRHPIHVQKSINSLQILSKGRIIIGIASGDRPVEFPAFKKTLENKAELFREHFAYLKSLQADFPNHASKSFGIISGNADLVPKTKHRTPFLVTGHAGQNMDWIAEHADGWLYYPRNNYILQASMESWSEALRNTGQPWKPYMQSLYIDLVKDSDTPPTPIHLGFKCSANYLLEYLQQIREIGVNHVILNLKFSSLSVSETLSILGKNIVPHLNNKRS